VGVPTPDRERRFRAVWDEHATDVYRYVARRVPPDGVDAADVVSDVFLVAWRRDADRPGGAETLPWLYGVARGVLANQRRSRERRLRLVTRLADVRIVPPSANEHEQLDEALARLGEDDREVLRLWAWEQLGTDEIAVALGCRPPAAASRLHRAKRRLREAMGTAGHRQARPATTTVLGGEQP
jgi:RNA polymerase sigma factor (sigma-70 family)